MRRLTFAVTVLVLTLCADGAHAGLCYGTTLTALWGGIVQLYGAGAYDRARGDILMLADGGFAPAQLLLGRMYAAGLGVDRSDSAAFFWLSLAKNRQIPLAAREVNRSGALLTPSERDDVRHKVEGWRPKTAQCDGIDQYQIPKLTQAKSVPYSHADLLRWWGDLIADMTERDPSTAIYMFSLTTVEFAASGANAGVIRHGITETLMVNSSLLNETPVDAAKFILPPAQAIVNEAALMVMPDRAEETYKGRHIMLWPVGDGDTIMAMIKQAIDMVDTLPPPLRERGGIVKEIRYIPEPPFNANDDANVPVEYVALSDTQPVGYLMLQFHPTTVSAATIATNFVISSQGVKRHKAYLASKNRNDERMRDMWAMLSGQGSGYKMTKDDLCQDYALAQEVQKALDLRIDKISAGDKRMAEMGCLN